MGSCRKQLRSRGQEDHMLSQPWGNSADQLAARTEQGLVASERQSVPAHLPARLPDEDGEQGDRDTSAQATHKRSKCQSWKPPVPPIRRPLYVDEGLGISLSRRGWRGDCLHRRSQGDCHTQTLWLRASTLQQSFREARWCCFITLIYPVPSPSRAKAGEMCARKQKGRPQLQQHLLGLPPPAPSRPSFPSRRKWRPSLPAPPPHPRSFRNQPFQSP